MFCGRQLLVAVIAYVSEEAACVCVECVFECVMVSLTKGCRSERVLEPGLAEGDCGQADLHSAA